MKKDKEQNGELTNNEINFMLDSSDYQQEMRIDPLTTSDRIKSELNQLELDRANREQKREEEKQKRVEEEQIERVRANLMSELEGTRVEPPKEAIKKAQNEL